MQLLILIFSLLFFSNSFGQSFGVDTVSIDTLHLKELKVKKVISFKFNSTIFYLSYNEYLKKETAFWKLHHNDMKFVESAKKKGKYINQEAVKNWLSFDSSYKDIKEQAKKSDTIFVTQNNYDSSSLFIENNFISDQLDKNRCSIVVNGERQQVLIRIKCSWYQHSRAAWFGRRYFLPGQKIYFLVATDLIS